MARSKTDARLGASVEFGDHMSATTTRDGKIIGFSESHGRGRAASGDADNAGVIKITVAGTSPRGEEGALQACQRLVEHLKVLGQSWSNPREAFGAPHIDATSEGEDALIGSTLKLQVVRALTDAGFWQSLDHHRSATISVSAVEAADLLKAAIESKVKKIPLEVRADLTLALDATDVPGLSLDTVIDHFNLRHGEWVDAQGFEGVWVVGPWREMVSRLGRAAD